MGADFMERQRIKYQNIFDNTRVTFLQFANDMLRLTLNDPEYMGKDIMSYKRIERIIEGTSHYYDEFIDCLDGRNMEADYLREKLDERLAQIYPKNLFLDFNQRYECVEKLVPIGKERKEKRR